MIGSSSIGNASMGKVPPEPEPTAKQEREKRREKREERAISFFMVEGGLDVLIVYAIFLS